MKKTLFTISILWLFAIAAWSQVPIRITFPEVETIPNTTFCVDVQASNFADIAAMQFAVSWDENLLNYKSVNIYKDISQAVPFLPNLNRNTQFGIKEGQLRFLWTNASGVTLPDSSTLFQICFQANVADQNTNINFSNAIVGQGVRSSDLESIPVTGESGSIIINASDSSEEEVKIAIGSATIRSGEKVCLPVTAHQFKEISGLQFSLDWNKDILSFSTLDLTVNPLSLTTTDYSYNEDVFRLSWINTSVENIPLPDTAILFEICFDAIGTNGSNTRVQVGDFIPVEVIRIEELVPVLLPTQTIAGLVNIEGTVDTEFDLIVGIGTILVNTNENFCIPITAYRFDEIASLQFALDWNQDIIRYDRLDLGDNPLQISSINYSFLDEFRMSWLESNIQNVTLLDSTVLFNICFDAIGSEGESTVVEIGDAVVFEASKVNETGIISIPTRSQSGQVLIDGIPQPPSEAVLIIANDVVVVETGENFCIPVTAYDFGTLVSLQFEIVWDEEKLAFEGLNLLDDPLNLDSPVSYVATENSLRLAWADITAQNIIIPDTAVLFELCFQAIAAAENITEITFGDTVPTEASRITNNGVEVFDVETRAGLVIISSNASNVYPGDTDLDGEVSHYDLINIGLGYGQTGPARDNPSLEFTPQPTEDWAISTPITNINYKHADTDGNGIINTEDTYAIDLNWSSVPNLATTIVTEDGIPFYVDTDTLRLIETNQLPIILGSEIHPAKKIYSIAFSIYYEADVMLTEGLKISLNNSWLGNMESELISVQRFFPNEKRIDVAISRIDQTGRTGFGEIGALNIVMEDVILFQQEGEVDFRIDHVRSIGEIKEGVAFLTPNVIAKVQQQTTHTDDFLARSVKIYPNPASSVLIISSKNIQIKRVILRNVFGKEVAVFENTTELNVSDLELGIYFLDLQTDKGQIIQKLSIQR